MPAGFVRRARAALLFGRRTEHIVSVGGARPIPAACRSHACVQQWAGPFMASMILSLGGQRPERCSTNLLKTWVKDASQLRALCKHHKHLFIPDRRCQEYAQISHDEQRMTILNSIDSLSRHYPVKTKVLLLHKLQDGHRLRAMSTNRALASSFTA